MIYIGMNICTWIRQIILPGGICPCRPVTSWIALIIRWLGNSAFAIRFFPAFFGALTILIVWKTVDELRNLFACILAATSLVFSALLRPMN